MTKTQQYLLSVLSTALFGSTDCPKAAVDYGELKAEALAQTVFSLVYPVVRDAIPSGMKADWSKTDLQILANNIRVNHEHAELHALMEKLGVPYTTIKGIASASYYPKPLWRMMGDVDFLVSPDDMETVGKELEQRGFNREPGAHGFHTVYHRQKVDWEMHFTVGGIPDNDCGKAIRKYVSEAVDNAEIYRCDDVTCRIPGPFHHGLIILMHMIQHLKGTGGIGLRHLCDWAVYVNAVDLDQYKPQYSEMGLWTFACLLTAVSTKYLKLRGFDWCPAFDDLILGAILEDFLAAGNFGKKDSVRSSSNRMVGESNVVMSLAVRTRMHFPFAKAHPLLLPAGMAAYLGRFLWLRLSGKKQWINSEALQEAKARKELYEQFHLFEA